ncbi:hypothetical protein [Methylobacterium bullatum]|uniref:hypothetical protein n=1 Tax=Methylobacterium bullatum TaxID=570505 RepID=UPI0030CB5436
MVLKDRYRSDDTPAGLGYSRIETDPERTPGREFVAACVRIGGFTTYEGYVLARDGKVTPEIGAALSGSDIAKVKQVAEGLRQAVAKCLAQLAAPRSSRPAHEIEKLISPSIGLDVVPLDAGCERLRVLGGPGLKQGGIPVELKLDGGVPTSSSDDLAAELIGWFPPRKKASAVLTNDDEPVAAVALYEALELGVSVYVSWTQDDIGMFGSAQQAIESLGVMNEEAEDLVRDIDSLKSGLDVTVPLRRTVGRRL